MHRKHEIFTSCVVMKESKSVVEMHIYSIITYVASHGAVLLP